MDRGIRTQPDEQMIQIKNPKALCGPDIARRSPRAHRNRLGRPTGCRTMAGPLACVYTNAAEDYHADDALEPTATTRGCGRPVARGAVRPPVVRRPGGGARTPPRRQPAASAATGAPLDVASATTIEFLLLSIRIAAKQRVQRGEDLLRLIERAGAIIDATQARVRMAARSTRGSACCAVSPWWAAPRGVARPVRPPRTAAATRRRDDGHLRPRIPRAFRRRSARGGSTRVSRVRGRNAGCLASDPGAARAAAVADQARLSPTHRRRVIRPAATGTRPEARCRTVR